MAGRSNTIKDIRSKIKHENVKLGSGTASSSFSSARQGIPHVGEIFGNHPGSVSLGGAGFPAKPQTSNQSLNVGGGPSFASLAPSDSISNFEGRQGAAPSSSERDPIYGHPHSPTAQSTASFAIDNVANDSRAATVTQYNGNAYNNAGIIDSPSRNDSSTPVPYSPLRPARSVRRPQQAPPLEPSGSVTGHERTRSVAQRPQLQIPPISSNRITAGPSSPARTGPGRDLLAASRAGHASQPSQSSISSQQHARSTPPSDRHTRSAHLMAKVARSGTPSSQPDSEQEEDIYGGISPVDPPSEGHANLYSNRSSGAQSLSVPGQRPERDPRRASGAPLGSLTHNEEPAALNSVLSALTSAGRKRQAARIMRGTTAEEESRRRRNEKKISEVAGQRRRPLTDYVDRTDSRAFREINAVLRKVKEEWPFVANDDFNSVALALSMLDDSSLGASRAEFEEVKQLIEHSLQGTVDDHYESFATAITLHNSVLQSLTSAQTSVSGARRRLRDSREALGAKRADLVQMWQRSQAVKESLRLLDLVEHLKAVPDRLESLMAEKRFLQAVNLLVRSLKTIDRAEILEVGATNDLRAYLKGQEHAMLEILIEELHNHLYLKSYFCDSRWKTYSPGQEELPAVDFGSDYKGDGKDDADRSNGAASKAGRDLSSATARGSEEHGNRPLKLHRYLQALRTRPAFDPNLASDLPETALMTTSAKSISSLTGELQHDTGYGGGGSSNGVGEDGFGNEFEQNPEADSFLYIEMLLESLSRLGKLGVALDTISQRLSIEVHQLVDATIDEVDVRNEPLRRFSIALRPESMLLSSSSALARSFTESLRSSRSSFNVANRPVSSMLRISANETSALQRDGETMRDLFWTLFSKLDAVLQGHRVIYEVAGMIASRAGFKDGLAAKKLAGVGSLIEVWKPIQNEVRTLLHDYLMDDEGTNSARNAIISVNDVLRDHKYGRDRSKQLFKLADAGVNKRGAARREVGPLKKHELAITEALKASVPGLVSSVDTGAGAGRGAGSSNQVIVSSASRRPEETYIGAGHRLLVKPDAFNVSVLFAPALSFIDRVASVMPSEAAGETSKGFSAFLEEFVQDVFLPQLEDKVQNLFVGATGNADAFLEDPVSRQQATATNKPVVKSASNVIVLMDSLYSMLCTTPFHRESYSRLIVTTVVQYYQKCGERFRDLVSIDTSATASSSGGGVGAGAASDSGAPGAATSNGIGGHYVLSASWAQRPEIYACLGEMMDPVTTPERRRELRAQEIRFELGLAATRPQVAVHELTTSRKKLLALGCLQHSIEWFLANVERLKPVSSSAFASSRNVKGIKDAANLPRSKRPQARLSVIDSLAVAGATANGSTGGNGNGAEDGTAGSDDDLVLPLSPELLARYRALPDVYRHLSSLILITIRLEVRLRIIAYLQLSVSEVSYVVNDTAVEPAPHIVDLNGELANLDDILSSTLPPQQKAFVFSGISGLMQAMLIGSVHKIRAINREGVTKMIRNILALQQNLKNILPEISFELSKRFFELLYSKSAEELFANMKRFKQRVSAAKSTGSIAGKGIGFAEHQAILHLALGISNGSAPTTSSTSGPAAASSADQLAKVFDTAGTLGVKDVSRKKLNEYLIELHDVAGEDSSDDE
ncbi:hypothetical protein BCV70DRAFT_157446 [Testicularia cyperi]|uniref:Exocyst complex component Sec8 n=1 Tax=Testicularia cyperi TaxID=1882483 RepID=A0A317XYA1_9BASI|nr:hypothetical protein BCV70DRAFT_157446 [Testicularia cyperi]